MKLLSLFPMFAAVCSATGPSHRPVDFKKWNPPGYRDVRSPCPLLNSLANHDIIPHNGKGLSTPLLVHALAVSINMSAETATTFAGIGLSASRDPASGTFDLDDLNRHNIVEHDASLSRRDFALNGASQAFSAEIFAETLAHLGDAEDITIPAAAAARYGRVETERKRNENFTYGARQQFASYLESALYYQALRDARTGKTPVDFFKVLFEQERLPYKEGWRVPNATIDAFSLSQDILSLALATPEKNDFFNETGPAEAFDGAHGRLR